MKIAESFSMALQNIWNSKMRSFLTMLGIIIGIAAVMVIIGLGNGMEGYMTDMFQSMGTNTLTVQITGQGTSSTVTADDLYEIVADNPEQFVHVTPEVSIRSALKVGSETMDYTGATGVGEDYFKIKGYTVAQGRGLTYMDMDARSKVCVVGSFVNDEWYNGRALGKSIRIAGSSFTIVGILEQEEDEPDDGGTDDSVYLPFTTASRLTGTPVSSYTVMIVSEDNVAGAMDALERALYEITRSEDAYMVISLSQILDIMSEMLDVMITILAVIAGISLVVGGIGIMNIMLVSVSERTREIGIRKALGAKERFILSQFVIEAAVTSAIGGIIGIIMGYALSSVATVLITSIMEVEMTVTPSSGSIALAFGASAAIGIAFGFLPARKAARLNPIDALRYD